MRKLCSDGTITLGTRRTAEEEFPIQASPISFVVAGAGNMRQFAGREDRSSLLNDAGRKLKAKDNVTGQRPALLQMHQYLKYGERYAPGGIDHPGALA